MNQHLKQLIELAEIDNEIDAFEPQIEEANDKYEAILAKKKSIDTLIIAEKGVECLQEL